MWMDIDVTVIVAGSYTVVASTFEPDLIGQFILTVASSTKIHTEAIPAEGAVSFIYRHPPPPNTNGRIRRECFVRCYTVNGFADTVPWGVPAMVTMATIHDTTWRSEN